VERTRYPEYLRGLMLMYQGQVEMITNIDKALETFYKSCRIFDLNFPES
jgi:hypothetical protein